MEQIQSAITQFKQISSEKDMLEFITKYQLKDAGEHENRQVRDHVKGHIGESIVTLTRRWYDRSRPFSIQPDGNEVKLEIDGLPASTVKFIDDHY